jgi:hypothetical protein
LSEVSKVNALSKGRALPAAAGPARAEEGRENNMPQPNLSRRVGGPRLVASILVATGAAAGAHRAAHAADSLWDGAVGNFDEPSNWNPDQVPGAGDNPIVNNGDEVLITTDHTVNDFRAGDATTGGPTATGTFTQSAGTQTVNSWTRVGIQNTGGVGTYNLSGGTLNANAAVNIGAAGWRTPARWAFRRTRPAARSRRATRPRGPG